MSDEDRVVPDTNTVVSALLWRFSVPAMALRKAEERAQIIASEASLIELPSVLSRPKFNRYVDWDDRQALYRSFLRRVRIVEVDEVVQVCRDPFDDKFLNLAVSGRAQTILSGDGDLLALHPFRGIAILSAADYLRLN